MVAVYTLTSILSAFLVFFIQPVAAKLALPMLGGTPAVWNGCMLFFQTMLLLGYLYAHGLSNWCKLKYQPYIHLALLLCTIALFPLSFDGAAGIDPAMSPMQWLLSMLFYALALPFFTISASSPLLQRWFANTNHPNAHNPYFLYAASNIGSMGALLAYPIVIEPLMRLQQQVVVWQIGIGLLVICFAMVSYFVLSRSKVALVNTAINTDISNEKIYWHMRLRWITLAFVPASLLYGVTAYFTSDIGSAPMLWLLPLTLYLITFIAVFANRPRGIDTALELHLPAALLLLVIVQAINAIFVLAIHVVGIFIIIWALHGLLARSKPSAKNLTEYFLWMSFGGVLGGIFNTLIAPVIFDTVAEYWLMIVLSVLVRHSNFAEVLSSLRTHRTALTKLALAAAVVLSLTYGVEYAFGYENIDEDHWAAKFAYYLTILLVPLLLFFAYRAYKTQYAAFALCLTFVMLCNFNLNHIRNSRDILLQERSVFGVYQVHDVKSYYRFMHGITNHGVQYKSPELRLSPRSYYAHVGEIFAALPPTIANDPVALVGLGVGTCSCYADPEQQMDIFEIDPLVVDIAANSGYFTYLNECAPKKEIIIGDARQKLALQQNDRYALIIMDAFSSDAIPTHLMTKEATQLYVHKIKSTGLLAFHVSNRHLELRPVLAAISQELELHAVYKKYSQDSDNLIAGSVWVVLTPNAQAHQHLINTGWTQMPTVPQKMMWTDDFSNLLFTFQFMKDFLGLPDFDE